MHLTVAIALCTYLVFSTVKAETCPPESILRPCRCFPEVGLTLQCKNLKDASVLDGVSRRTGDITFEKFRMLNSSIDSIPPSTLTKKRFKIIELTDSELHSLFEEVGESNNIRTLSLAQTEFEQKFPWSQLKPLKNLRSLIVQKGFLPELADDFKNNVNKDLISLSLSESYTRWISEGVFSEYKELTDVIIAKSGLRKIKRNYFSRPAAKLFQLKLDGNEIRVLPNDIFEEMPKLQFVSLKENKLTTISEAVFKPLDHQLGFIYLYENPLKCDCDLKWVVASYVDGVDGYCQSGLEELKGKQLRDLKPEDFQSCP